MKPISSLELLREILFDEKKSIEFLFENKVIK